MCNDFKRGGSNDKVAGIVEDRVEYVSSRRSVTKLRTTESRGGGEGAHHLRNHAMMW